MSAAYDDLVEIITENGGSVEDAETSAKAIIAAIRNEYADELIEKITAATSGEDVDNSWVVSAYDAVSFIKQTKTEGA